MAPIQFKIKNKKDDSEIEQQIKRILSANDSSFPNFYSKYIKIDTILYENRLKKDIICNFKDDKQCSFIIKGNTPFAQIILQTGNEKIILGNENSIKEAHILCDRIDRIIAERHLYFSPNPTSDFVQDILSAKKGDILSYNSRYAFVCIDDTPNQMVFKYAFHGDIRNIQIEDFKNSEMFYIKDENSHDLKYIYSLAYNYKSSSVIRKKYDFKLGNGYYPVTEIEQAHIPGSVTECEVGNCKLRLINNDKKYIWLDVNGQQIERDTVVLLFAWLKTTIADIDLIDYNWDPNPDIDENIIRTIENDICDQNQQQLMKHIYDYAIQNNNYASISFTGLQQNGFVWKPVTFAFNVDENEIPHVYKMIYENDNFYIIETNESDFLAFYNQRYETVKNITLKKYSNYTEEQKNVAFKEAIKKTDKKYILGELSSTEKTDINNIINSYVRNRNSQENGISPNEIIDITDNK